MIAKFKEDGTIASLKEKWLGADESVKVLTEQTYRAMREPSGIIMTAPMSL